MSALSVYCPRCNSTDVDVVALDIPEGETISMDDLGTPNVWAVPAVIRYIRYRAICRKCGYMREYSAGAI